MERGADSRGRDRGWERWARATGVLFVVLALIGFFFAPDPPGADASNQEVLEYFNDKEGELRTQAMLFALAAAALLWFIGTFAAVLRRWLTWRWESRAVGDTRRNEDDHQRLPPIIVASGATAVGVYLAGTAAYTALATRAGQEIDESAGRALFELGGALITFVAYPAAVFVYAGALGAMRTRRLPDWLGWVGFVIAAILLIDGIGATVGDSDTFGPSGPIGVISFLSFLLWVLLASGLLAWREWDDRDADTRRRAATGARAERAET